MEASLIEIHPIETAQTFSVTVTSDGIPFDFYTRIKNGNINEIFVDRNYYKSRNEWIQLSTEKRGEIEELARVELTRFINIKLGK